MQMKIGTLILLDKCYLKTVNGIVVSVSPGAYDLSGSRLNAIADIRALVRGTIVSLPETVHWEAGDLKPTEPLRVGGSLAYEICFAESVIAEAALTGRPIDKFRVRLFPEITLVRSHSYDAERRRLRVDWWVEMNHAKQTTVASVRKEMVDLREWLRTAPASPDHDGQFTALADVLSHLTNVDETRLEDLLIDWKQCAGAAWRDARRAHDVIARGCAQGRQRVYERAVGRIADCLFGTVPGASLIEEPNR